MANDMAVRIAEGLKAVAQAIDDCFNSLAGTHGRDSIYAANLLLDTIDLMESQA